MKPKKSGIYTRTGDGGTTSLVDGSRIAKNSLRLDAYGSVDELNSAIGAAMSFMDADDSQLDVLSWVQNTLFNVGAALATDADKSPELAQKMFPGAEEAVTSLESAIDSLDATLPPMTGFILPQGVPSATLAHVARAVCRRAERHTIALAAEATVCADIITYLNRLSDYLFLLARHNNIRAGIKEINWKK